MTWTLYYEDGTRFTDQDGYPWDSPIWGVIAVGQPQNEIVGKHLTNGYAYLYRTDWDCWMEVQDQTGFIDHIAHHARHVSTVRFGRYTRRDWFMEVKKEVEIAAGIRPAT